MIARKYMMYNLEVMLETIDLKLLKGKGSWLKDLKVKLRSLLVREGVSVEPLPRNWLRQVRISSSITLRVEMLPMNWQKRSGKWDHKLWLFIPISPIMIRRLKWYNKP